MRLELENAPIDVIGMKVFALTISTVLSWISCNSRLQTSLTLTWEDVTISQISTWHFGHQKWMPRYLIPYQASSGRSCWGLSGESASH